MGLKVKCLIIVRQNEMCLKSLIIMGYFFMTKYTCKVKGKLVQEYWNGDAFLL